VALQEHTRSATPPITSVDLRPELLARVAVTTLVNRIDELDRPVPPGPLRGRLIVRESSRRCGRAPMASDTR
jgi:DNA-binding LacI/PurR family transcriptional regulator